MSISRIEGKIIVTSNEPLTAEKILQIEQLLNGETALYSDNRHLSTVLYQEFKAGIRVHLGLGLK